MRKVAGLALAIILAACAAPVAPKPPTVIGVIQGVTAELAKPRIDALRAEHEAAPEETRV